MESQTSIFDVQEDIHSSVSTCLIPSLFVSFPWTRSNPVIGHESSWDRGGGKGRDVNRNWIKILHVITCPSDGKPLWFLSTKMAKVCSSRNRIVRLIEKLSREQAKEMWLCDPLTQIAWHTANIFRWIENTYPDLQ